MLVRKISNLMVHKIYRPYLKRFPIFETLAFLIKYRLVPFFSGKGVQRYKHPTWICSELRSRKIKKVAVICDEMTWQNFQGEFELIFLTPQNWYDELERFKPDLFFCESAWTGINDHHGCWDYRVIHNTRLLFDNRVALLKILYYCNKVNIPTIFWNKEDPTFFCDEVNNFVDTALLFDHIFTTAAECVPLYQKMGHNSVHVMMFGFSPRLFYPIKESRMNNKAVFFGSWYTDQPQRCADMAEIFDMVIDKGIELVIYDRNWNTDNESIMFPEKYKPYIKGNMHYSDIRNALQDVKYVININTVKDSETMFARRVFEMMACGKIIISNYSKGMMQLFDGRIWFADKPFNIADADKIIQKNIEDVFSHHTWSSRMDEMIRVVGFERRIDGGIHS